MGSNTSGRPSWQSNRVFKFFASLQLAMVLLAVLIVAAIAGTIYESTFDAKVARAYIYGAAWFNLWLLLLVANLAGSAFSRWPWRKHHVAFLVTHLGIITLLFGSLIGRIWGIEGTTTLFKGEPPSNRLLLDQHQLRVHDTDGVVKGYAAEFINRRPTPQHPLDLGALASGARLSIVGYAPAVEGKLNPKSLDAGGVPALHFNITTAKMGQHLESWLMADDPQHGNFDMGLARIELKRGRAPNESSTAPNESKPTGEVDIDESIFAFAKASDQQIAKALKGGSTGAKVSLSQPQNGDSGSVTIRLGDKTWTHDVAPHLQQDVPLDGSPFNMRIEAYWPDFRIENGRPTSISDQPNNPAVVVTLRGRAVPVAAQDNAHAPNESAPQAPANRLTLFIADDGAITYDLSSRKEGHSSGPLEINSGLTTGWADWQLVVDRVMPHAEQWIDFEPVAETTQGANIFEGVRVRVQQNGHDIEQWVPAGWQIAIPTEPQPIQLAYGWKQQPLPIALQLTEFEVQRNEGSDAPAGFKSTLRVLDRDGGTATGQCWMNHPFSYPGAMWRTWTGLTFKMSQASWNPENLDQSTIQILRDPGWLLKWIGSVLVCSGIFMLFYVKKFRRPSSASKTKRDDNATSKPLVTAQVVIAGAMILLSLGGCAHGRRNIEREAAREQKKLDRQAAKAKSARAAGWGYFSGEVDARWSDDGRNMTLLNDLRYTDPYGQVWIAPAGSVVDGASIPRPLWGLIGGPFEGKYRKASVLHDVAYERQDRPFQDADLMFYNAMRASGVGVVTAKTMYYSLVRHGRHWRHRQAVPVDADPKRSTEIRPGEIDEIQRWVRTTDPNLKEIQARAADTTR